MLDLDSIKSKTVQKVVTSLPSNMVNIGLLVIIILFSIFIITIKSAQIETKIEVNAKISIINSIVTGHILLPYKKITSTNNPVPLILHTKNGGIEIKAKMNINKRKVFIDARNIFWCIPLENICMPNNVMFSNGDIQATSFLRIKEKTIFKWIYDLIVDEEIIVICVLPFKSDCL